jgi:hypothetical protein
MSATATPSTTREDVKRLVDALPEGDLSTVARLLRGLLALEEGGEPMWTLEDAPEDDPLPDEVELLEDARAREARGEVEYVSHEEARRILLGEGA